MDFLLGEYVASTVGRDNHVCPCFYLTVTKALRYRKGGKGSNILCKYDAYSFCSGFVCIISFGLARSVSYGVTIINSSENQMTCSWLTCNRSGHLILSEFAVATFP